MQETDVLIIGGGPAGTALALELAVQKIPFRIIDKAAKRSEKPRALGLQPRSLELISRHGDVSKLYTAGVITPGPTVYVNGNEVLQINLSGICKNSRFELPLMTPQYETERFLDEYLAKHGNSVEHGIEAKGIVQDESGVTASLCMPGGKEKKIRAKYVVGTDGAHSIVRHSCKSIVFEGLSYPQEFLLCDVRVRGSQKPDLVKYALYLGQGTAAIFPLANNMVRVAFLRDQNLQGTKASMKEAQDGFDRLISGGGELHDPMWLTEFRLHHRLANKYREGRLFIAGDAAHFHSPVGGQGMNTGMQDAINLAWKLGRVIRGECPESFLDTYEAERRPVGQNLINTTDRTFTWGTISNPVLVFLRNILLPWVVSWLTRSPTFEEDVFSFMSEFGLNYMNSSLVATGTGITGPVLGGDRAPDSKVEIDGKEDHFVKNLVPGSHHLVFFSGNGDKAAAKSELESAIDAFNNNNVDNARVLTISVEKNGGQSTYTDINEGLHREYELSGPSYVYIRPDSYVAHIGLLSNLHEFLNWLH